MKICSYGLPPNLLNSYYKTVERKNSLLQVLDMKDYSLYPVTFSIPHLEVMKFMYNLSQVMYFDTVYVYNLFDYSSELYLDNGEFSFTLNFNGNDNLNVNDNEHSFDTKTDEPWLFPYDKILIPNLNDLDFFMVDIEEISLSFLLVKKGIKDFIEIEKILSRNINKEEVLAYIRDLPFDDELKIKIVVKSNYS